MDGCIYALPSPATDSYRLWATHDGGTTWRDVTQAAVASGSQILAMEVRSGQVDVVTIPANSNTIHVESSPVGTDNWTDTDTRVQIGAGPIPSAELVLQDRTGWLIENDRTVIAGGMLVPPTGWASWQPPCLTANGLAFLAASSQTDLVAVCNEGERGPAGNLPAGATTPSEWMFSSSDGGASFQPVTQLPATFAPPGGRDPLARHRRGRRRPQPRQRTARECALRQLRRGTQLADGLSSTSNHQLG
jgi:hypothetical protein